MTIKKLLKPIMLVVLALVVGGMVVGCMLPAYQLWWYIDSVTLGANQTTVYYEIQNIGEEPLVNATIQFTLQDAGLFEREVWLPGMDLEPGEGYSGLSYTFIHTGFTSNDYWVSGAGWDTE